MHTCLPAQLPFLLFFFFFETLSLVHFLSRFFVSFLSISNYLSTIRFLFQNSEKKKEKKKQNNHETHCSEIEFIHCESRIATSKRFQSEMIVFCFWLRFCFGFLMRFKFQIEKKIMNVVLNSNRFKRFKIASNFRLFLFSK